jgi:ADP-heptose:LPS heptosyltransferase
VQGWACVCRLGGLGDNLVAASVLAPLKRLGYMVEMLTSESFACIFQNNPSVDKLSIKRDEDIPKGAEWVKWFVARGHEYMGGLWNLSHSMEKQHALFETDTNFWWPQDFRRKLCAGSYLETVWDIVGLPTPYEFGQPLFFPTDEEREIAQKTKAKIGKRYLAWVLSGSRVDKVYPYTAQTICRIIKELNIPVVMFGVGGRQFEMAKTVEEDVRRTNSSTEGLHLALSPENSDPGGHQHWSVRRSLSQAIAADLVITPDTGMAWAVAMEAMPKIVLISHASAENITKHWRNTTTLHADPDNVPCWPCHRLHNTMATCTPFLPGTEVAACMADISVERIMGHIERLWEQDHDNGIQKHRHQALEKV